ncbi:MAG: hypothetical protein IKD96_07045 [Oscillospiraceae bacterium]|nr:hypothetical protein [Oscillospiraceae bacterium]
MKKRLLSALLSLALCLFLLPFAASAAGNVDSGETYTRLRGTKVENG